MREKLELALEHFEHDGSDWGLGQTYYFLGRTHAIIESEDSYKKT